VARIENDDQRDREADRQPRQRCDGEGAGRSPDAPWWLRAGWSRPTEHNLQVRGLVVHARMMSYPMDAERPFERRTRKR
jgi:hypothetical protein